MIKNQKFSFSTIQSFDEHILNSIQGYPILDDNIVSLAKYFLEDNTNLYDLGCSTGRQMNRIKKTYPDKKVNFIGIEKEINLTNQIARDKNVKIIDIDLEQAFIFANASLILSTFTLQFIRIDKRQDIINSIYKGLNKGGAFILSEKVYSQNSKIQDILTFQYYDFKSKNFTANEILSKERDLRSIMKPLALEDYKLMLKKAGFEIFDVFFRNYNFVSILAIK